MTQAKREQVMVGLFVLVAAALLVGTVFAVGGISGRQVKTYHAYFPFAGGVEPGTDGALFGRAESRPRGKDARSIRRIRRGSK